MRRSPNSPSAIRDQQSLCELPFDELDSLLLGFDPTQEWILDSDHLFMSADESKGSFEPKVAGLDVFVDTEAGLCLQSEIMHSAAGLDSKSLEFLKFDSKSAELCLLVDEKAKDDSFGGEVDGGSCNGDGDDKVGVGIMQHRHSNGGCNDNDIVNVGTIDSGVSATEKPVGVSEEKEVMEVEKPKENGLLGDSVKTSDEKSTGREVKEAEEEDTSSEDDSSSSSSDDEEEEEDSDGGSSDDQLHSCMSKQLQVADDGEMEEGEIKDDSLELEDMVFDSDEEEEVGKGPIRSKNESEVLPPVPKVDVALEEHHQTLPVGFILSILDNRVVVATLEKDNNKPLNEGSILWITESRTPLGFIDEIFGPVKNPYYVVRFNSYKDIPAGSSEGCAVSFVQEFASYVLNPDALSKKGYDASGDNDEELDDEPEFSDDEKEAEYKKSLKQAKRGNRDRVQQNPKSMNSKRNNQKQANMNKSFSTSVDITGVQQQASVPSGSVTQSVAAGIFGSSGVENATDSSFNSAPQVGSCLGNIPQQNLNIPWLNGFPQHHQQLPAIQGLLMNMLASHQHQHQFNIPNGVPFQQQFFPGLQPPINSPWPGGFMIPSAQPAPFGIQPPVSSPFVAGNFGSMPFGSNGMQRPVNPATPDQQLPVSSPFIAGNFGSMPFGSNGMQQPVNPATPDQQIPVSSPFIAGNFGSMPFGSNGMQQPINPATPDQQIPGHQRPATVAGGPRPHMQINHGRPPFRGGRRPHRGGGRHSFGRGGRAGNH